LGLYNPKAGPQPAALTGTISFTQDGLTQTRMRGDFRQIAAILKGSAPGRRARFVGFVDIVANSLTREVDITSPTFVDFSDDQLVYSADGARVFITNGQQIIGVESGGLFGISAKVIPDTGADTIRQLGVSDDGKALAMTIASLGNAANWVVL